MTRRDGRTPCPVCLSPADRCDCFGPPLPRHAGPRTKIDPAWLIGFCALALIAILGIWGFSAWDEARGLHHPPEDFWPTVEQLAAYPDRGPLS